MICLKKIISNSWNQKKILSICDGKKFINSCEVHWKQKSLNKNYHLRSLKLFQLVLQQLREFQLSFCMKHHTVTIKFKSQTSWNSLSFLKLCVHQREVLQRTKLNFSLMKILQNALCNWHSLKKWTSNMYVSYNMISQILIKLHMSIPRKTFTVWISTWLFPL